MPQLDSLIGALLMSSAKALVLEKDQQPVLLIDGTRRPIARATLSAERVLALVNEITPAAEGIVLAGGRAASFVYSAAETPVRVEVEPGPRVTIRALVAAKPAAVTAEPVSPRPVAARGEPSMDELLRTLVQRGGSDLHLSSDTRPRLRIDGDLMELEGMPVLDAGAAERLLLQVAPARNRQEFQERHDTDFAYELPGLARIRCNLFRDRKGPGGVFRVIPMHIMTVQELGFTREMRELCRLTKGLVLVTGPTGSGKSTTLAAFIDQINNERSQHVITIEDPIEFVHSNRKCLVNQREVHSHTESFKSALRAALREDPDVVLVGELRDLQTVTIALETAETGHLVFGTLHTNSAVSTVDRLIDQFPGDQQAQIRIMLSESLKAVIAQVLCRRLAGGRIAALEVMMVTQAIANLIREGKAFQIPSLMQTGRKHGMVPLNDALLELVKKKVVAPEEAYLKATDKQGLLSAFKNQRINVELEESEALPVTT